MITKIGYLIEEATRVIKEYKQIKDENCDEFNIFRITGIHSDEVKMCKMLAEIIDPHGSHKRGAFFLESFMNEVLGLNADDAELNTAEVKLEYHTFEDRRIDIVIETNRRFVPIEVKIYAGDQRRQCRDYYDFAIARHKPEHSKVYYLTLDGHLPQGGGAEGLTPIEEKGEVAGYEEILTISFKKDICTWLGGCFENQKLSENNTLRVTIEQFVYALEELTGNMGNRSNEEISKFIGADRNSFMAASLISDGIFEAKKAKLFELFSAIEARLDECDYPYEKVYDKYNYRYNNGEPVNSFYNSNRKTWPSLTYRYKKLDGEKEIWFRIEVECHLYCGFVVAQNAVNPGELVLSRDEINRNIRGSNALSKCAKDTWWHYWEWLIKDDERSSPNFKYTNETMIELFDKEYFDSFVKKCVERIIELTK